MDDCGDGCISHQNILDRKKKGASVISSELRFSYIELYAELIIKELGICLKLGRSSWLKIHQYLKRLQQVHGIKR